jgi:hypothetical protein
MDDMSFCELPVAGDETAVLLGVLDRTRRVFAWKTGGLDPAGLQATLGPSTVTLGGLLKHLALTEDFTFSTKLFGRDPGPPWNTIDWDTDPDWEWRSAASDTPEDLYALWRAAVERSRASVAEALARGDLGQLVEWGEAPDRHVNLRRLVVDMIDEYARHNGHADLIRESLDGLVGEDPPGTGLREQVSATA